MVPCSSVMPVDRLQKKGMATLSSRIVTDPGAASALLALYAGLIHLFAFYYLADHRKVPAIWPRGGVNQLMGSGHGDDELARVQTTWSCIEDDFSIDRMGLSSWNDSSPGHQGLLHLHFIVFSLLLDGFARLSATADLKTMNFSLQCKN